MIGRLLGDRRGGLRCCGGSTGRGSSASRSHIAILAAVAWLAQPLWMAVADRRRSSSRRARDGAAARAGAAGPRLRALRDADPRRRRAVAVRPHRARRRGAPPRAAGGVLIWSVLWLELRPRAAVPAPHGPRPRHGRASCSPPPPASSPCLGARLAAAALPRHAGRLRARRARRRGARAKPASEASARRLLHLLAMRPGRDRGVAAEPAGRRRGRARRAGLPRVGGAAEALEDGADGPLGGRRVRLPGGAGDRPGRGAAPRAHRARRQPRVDTPQAGATTRRPRGRTARVQASTPPPKSPSRRRSTDDDARRNRHHQPSAPAAGRCRHPHATQRRLGGGRRQANRQLLELGPDTDAYNRLGKALAELGRHDGRAGGVRAGARRATPRTGSRERNVERAARAARRWRCAGSPATGGPRRPRPRDFIEEMGKTGHARAHQSRARRAQLAPLSPGDAVELVVEGDQLMATVGEDRRSARSSRASAPGSSS